MKAKEEGLRHHATAPRRHPHHKESFFMLPDNRPEHTDVMVMFRILTRREWERVQDWHKACPGSTVEHLMHGLYVLMVPAGGARKAAA